MRNNPDKIKERSTLKWRLNGTIVPSITIFEPRTKLVRSKYVNVLFGSIGCEILFEDKFKRFFSLKNYIKPGSKLIRLLIEDSVIRKKLC